MLKPLLSVLVTAGVLLLVARIVPGIAVSGLTTALVAAVVWGIMDLTIRPIVGLLTLPINFVTLGLFSFVLNAFMFWLLAAVMPGFTVSGFIPALEGSLILAVTAWVLHIIL